MSGPGDAAAHAAVVWLRRLLAATGSGQATERRHGVIVPVFQCPAHRDDTPSMIVDTGDRSPVVTVRCRANCRTVDVLRVLRLSWAHLRVPPAMTPDDWVELHGIKVTYPPVVTRSRPGPGSSTARLESTHHYGPDYYLERWRDQDGSKGLLWFSRNPRGEMVPGLLGRPVVVIPMYRAADIGITAATGEPLFLVESESSVDALNGCGHYATTWPGSASTVDAPTLAKISAALSTHPDVRVVADHDDPGIAAARAILGVLPNAAGLIPPTPGHDVRDVIAAGDRALATLARLPLADSLTR